MSHSHFFPYFSSRHRRKARRWRLEELERRDNPAGVLSNVDGNLSALYRLTHSPAVPDVQVGNDVESLAQVQSLLQFDRAGLPVVQIWARSDAKVLADQLRTLGVTPSLVTLEYRLVEAHIEIDLLTQVANLPEVLSVTPVYRPEAHSGSVQSQGDGVLRADLVRTFGFDGAPLKVGVLSDSALNIQSSQATGDLPSSVDRFLEFPYLTDEGRAMMEIVYDVAPGAAIAHHSAFESPSSFANGIRKLAAIGSNVIVDDVGYLDEPFFQDGIIAQAVNEVAAAGVTYVSAAGNSKDLSYEGNFNASGTFHDFDPGAGTDTKQRITVPSGFNNRLILQWDDPFYTTSGVTHNFDVKVYTSVGGLVVAGATNNVSTQQPLEIVSWDTSGSGNVPYDIEIERKAGSGASVLKWVLYSGTAASVSEFATNSSTIFGHPAAMGAIAVGAVPWYTPNTIEPFSSVGDVAIYFDAAGNRLGSTETRLKPDVVGPDGANTTFFGSDIAQDPDTFPNFFGTSAAAPHVAAAAVLVLDANPHLTRLKLRNILTSTAVDLGLAGRDRVYGYGRVDAEAARSAALAVTDVTSPIAQLVSPVLTHGWPVGTLKVKFSEPMASGPVGAATNYTLRDAGADNTFGTGDDVAYTVSVSHDTNSRTTTVTPTSPTTLLPIGLYRLTLDATGGLIDPAGNAVNGGTDQVLAFAVDSKSSIIPQSYVTGGTASIAIRSDGTMVVVQPGNPLLGIYAWPQLLVGQFDPGGAGPGAFLSTPTDIYDSYRVTYPDVAVKDTGGVIFYGDRVFNGGSGGEPPYYDLAHQMIDATGRSTGARMLVGGTYANTDPVTRVVMTPTGAFIAAWSGVKYFSGHYQNPVVSARRYNAAGVAVAAAFEVCQTIGATSIAPAIADDGSALFVWILNGNLMARRYDAAGIALGNEFLLSAAPPGEAYLTPHVARKADGSFIVAWQSVPSGSSGNTPSTGIFVQRFTAAGIAQGPRVAVFVRGTEPQVAVAADGRFVVAFSAPDDFSDADTNDDGVFVQRFNSDGTYLGTRLWLDSTTTGLQRGTRVSMMADGRFAVAWTGANYAAFVRYLAWTTPSVAIPYGPYIRESARVGGASAAMSSVLVTFDRLINTSSFTTADVTITDPVGRSVAPSSLTTSDNQTFTVSFPSQTLPGRYTVTVGPSLTDTASNSMNQDGDSLNGETTVDAFVGYFWRDPPTAATVPFTEGFEVADVDALNDYWSFTWNGGVIDVTNLIAPTHGGTKHLRLANTGSSGYTQRETMLKLDLSANAGATNLFLDFWVKRQANFTEVSTTGQLSVSGDGTTWIPVTGTIRPSATDLYLQHVYDLDQQLAAAGVALDGDVYLKLYQQSFYVPHGLTIDDVRIGTTDTFGPRITGQSVTGTVSGPVASVNVTFNKAIDPATFTAADVTFISPSGAVIALSGDPVNTGDNKTFTLNLATAQSLRGTYRLSIGPDVRDPGGSQMNQNSDNVNGEVDSTDTYSSTFDIGPSVAQAFPYTQGFESGDILNLPGWSFGATAGLIEVTGSSGPQSGNYHLRMTGAAPSSSYREAVVKLNLSAQAGATNLTLDYWIDDFAPSSFVHNHRLDVSGNGTTWINVGGDISLSDTSGIYVHRYWDLDSILAAASVALDGDVYLKISQTGTGSNQLMTFDNFRVSTTETIGPRITAHTPSTQQAGPVSSLTATFNEDIDAATFTASDVQVISPSGQLVTLAGDPVDSGNHRTFTINLAAGQTLRGLYSLKVGPDVRDLAGNWMNQDQDNFNAEPTNDVYIGTFTIAPSTAQTLPTLETFEGASLGALAGWSFEVTNYAPNNGTIDITGADGPYQGVNHLRFTSGTLSNNTKQDAILKLDLSAQSSATDVVLDFWLERAPGSATDNALSLSASGNGTSWFNLSANINVTATGIYFHKVFDLDLALSNVGIARDADVYLKFENYSNTGAVMAIDNVRVQQGTLNNAPTLTSISTLISATEDTAFPIDYTALATAANEADANGDPISFRVEAVSSGTLTKGGNPVVPGVTLLASGETWIWTPAQDANGTGANALNGFIVRAYDGDLVSAPPVQVKIGVTAINDAPVLDNSGDMVLTGILEDEVTNGGMKVVDLIASAGGDRITDVDVGALEGIAIIAADTTGGAWQYSLNNGSNWSVLGSVSNTSARLLMADTNTRVRLFPNADSNGTLATAITFRAWDRTAGVNGGTADVSTNGGITPYSAATETVSLTVTAVNDVPSFTKGSNQTVLEDAGAQNVTGWATAISKGPANESSQALTFLVTTNNDALFAVLPAVAADGKLTYTPAANANGSATVTVKLKDDGGTANSGVDTSAAQTFPIAVTAVNDVPSFTKGANQSVNEDAGAQAVTNWATSIVAGPADENGQTLTFLITTDNDGLFSTPPAIDAAGKLTYTPATNANGSATVTLRLKDNGGTANSGVDTSAAQTFTIAVAAVNDAPVLDNSGDMTLGSILEDATGNNGTKIVDLLASAGDRIADVDAGAVEGVAVIAADTANGSWQFSTNNGTDWNTLGSVSTTSGRLLASDADTRIRFVPGANFNGTIDPAVIFRAWDQSSGANGGTADPSSNGGTTAFSVATETASLVVTAVNDMPSFTKGSDQSVLEDAGAQSVTNWATAISRGPANESGQSLTFLVTTDNDALFSAGPAVAADGKLTYTPAANANGSATVTVNLKDDGGTTNGGIDTSTAQTFTITATAVNDVPSFTKGANPSVNEDAGVQAVTGWATNILAGPADENGQTLTFLVTTDNDGLFSTLPAIDATGQLTYTAAADANGSATVTVNLKDNGGTANSGVDISAAQTFTITIAAVNDVPSFTKGNDQAVLEDAGAQSVNGWASSIATGPTNESGQTRTFLVTTDNDGLFAFNPAIDADGMLTFTPAVNANGSATVTVRLKDDGGTANGGVDVSAAQTFTIAVTAVNDAPSFTKGANQSVNEDAGAQAVTGWASNILAGPADETGQVLTFLVTTDNDALFAIGPAIDPVTGTLTFTSVTDTDGIANVAVRLRDNGSGTDTSLEQAFQITVNAVNDMPAFTNGGDQTVDEDAGLQTVVGWASAMSAGPANESGQDLDFLVATDNNALFSTGPSVDVVTGDLTFTPAVNANGVAHVTVRLHDNGGGTDTSIGHPFQITVNSINDVPAFSAGGDQFIDENSGPQVVPGWAAVVKAGPADESGQALDFLVTTDNDALFDTAPAVDPVTGTLTYTPTADINGIAHVTIRLHDSGGGTDTSADQTFEITVGAVNNPPTINTIANLDRVEDDPQQTVNLVGLSPGPVDEFGQTLTITAMSSNHALFADPVVAYAGGSAATLTFTPLPNVNGTATITVTVHDNGGGSDTTVHTFLVTVAAAPDRPAINTTFTPMFPAMAMPIKTAPIGATIAGLIAHVSDPDAGDPSGIAIVAADTVSGKWEYSTNSGQNWIALPTVSDTTALLLANNATTRVRFLPGPKFKKGFARLTYKAWDQTENLVDTTSTASTSISLQTEHAWMAVGKTTPIVDGAGHPLLKPVKEDARQSAAFSVKKFLGLLAKETDPTKVFGIAVSADSGSGTWQFNIGKGGWQNIGSITDGSALLLRPTDRVRFQPAHNFDGLATLTYHTWDRAAWAPGTRADATATGFSEATETALLNLIPVNDAPVLNPTTNPTLGSVQPGQSMVATSIGSVVAAGVTDVDSTGIGIYVLKASGGTWEYKNATGTWIIIKKPVYLTAATELRFTAATNALQGTATLSFKAWDESLKPKAVSKAKGNISVTILP